MHLDYLSLGFSTLSACLFDSAFVVIMTSQYYTNHLLDQLHNFHHGHISKNDYIAIFEDLTRYSDVREHRSQTITRFVWGEEAFDIALRIDLTFKGLVNAKAHCFKCEGYGHYVYQCPSKSRHVSTVFSDDVDDSKVIEDVLILLRLLV